MKFAKNTIYRAMDGDGNKKQTTIEFFKHGTDYRVVINGVARDWMWNVKHTPNMKDAAYFYEKHQSRLQPPQ